MFSEQLKKELAKVLKEIRIEVSEDEIIFEHPAETDNGDHSTNIALQVKSPASQRGEQKSKSQLKSKK